MYNTARLVWSDVTAGYRHFNWYYSDSSSDRSTDYSTDEWVSEELANLFVDSLSAEELREFARRLVASFGGFPRQGLSGCLREKLEFLRSLDDGPGK